MPALWLLRYLRHHHAPQVQVQGLQLSILGNVWHHLCQPQNVIHRFAGRINHSEAYATLESCTNQVESYFSRLRRMIRGQHHHVSARYLAQYANHAAWLEDHRGLPNGELAGRVGDLALAHPVSRNWKGYWQKGSKRR